MAVMKEKQEGYRAVKAGLESREKESAHPARSGLLEPVR